VPFEARQLRHVRAGDRIDVLSTFSTYQGGAKRILTATMLQNVKVLGVDLPCHAAQGSLILKLNPNEAQYAAGAPAQSDLAVAVRKEGDNDIYPMEMASFVKFFR
jgi:Flp pilus assembly protein CpaB